MQKLIKLYATKDASLDISLRLDLLCWIFGVAANFGNLNQEVTVRMIALHLGPVCLTFTSFGIRDVPLPRAPFNRRSPTRQSGAWKPK